MRCRGLHFGQLTPTILTQQERDKPGLYQDNRGDEANLPGIPFPYGWLPKQDFAPRWQAALADVPALKLSPIVFRCCELDRRNLDATCLLSSQHSDGNSSSRSSTLRRGEHRAANNLTVKESLVERKNRSVGDLIDALQWLLAPIDGACAIHR
jgi:hypothetical protein